MEVQKGDVIAVDGRGDLSTGVFGEMLMTYFKAQGGAGVVIDAAIRDSRPIFTDLQVPVWSRGVTTGGAGHGNMFPHSFNIPIGCGGVLVNPGDIIMADDGGAIVIPPITIPHLLEIGGARDYKEIFVRKRLSEGGALRSYYPFDAKGSEGIRRVVENAERVIDYNLKIAEYRINGYAVIEDALPVATVDRIRDAFLPMLEHVRTREDIIAEKEWGDLRTGFGRQQVINRYTLTIPWVPPFADPAVYENPLILEFLERYWGTENFHVKCFHSNSPYPGSEFQHWHRDTNLPSEIPYVGLDTCPIVGVKFPLVDTSEENGSFEVLPSTQYIASPQLEGRYDEVLTSGPFPFSPSTQHEKGHDVDSGCSHAAPGDAEYVRCAASRNRRLLRSALDQYQSNREGAAGDS